MNAAEFIPDWFAPGELESFASGTHCRIHRKFGAHSVPHHGTEGTHFAVWAPDSTEVTVVPDQHPAPPHRLQRIGNSGVWSGFVPRLGPGAAYRFQINSHSASASLSKADPVGFQQVFSPAPRSVVSRLDYDWHDAAWMESRPQRQNLDRPISIYEVHPGSWRRVPEENHRPLTFRELAPLLAEYVRQLGFTHVEFLPLMAHPFDGSWGYQITGYFAPAIGFGTPQDLMFLVDTLHQNGIGVILDWVPSHFAVDEHGLARFDGTPLYEHPDKRKGFHPDWNSCIFNYARPEVRSFLLSNALYWLEEYHADGLRVDGVASMLYLDYSRPPEAWLPNEHGGRENLEAVDFLHRLNETAYREHPDIQMFAEESSAWPRVSWPTYLSGLGFGFKWDMGFTHDTLEYFSKEPVHRKYFHNLLTFRGMYAFNEHFVLPLSHDDVTPERGSLLARMPGDEWQKFAGLRLLLAYLFFLPGKKLLFMGDEFGQWNRWRHDSSLDWSLIQEGNRHNGLQRLTGTLNWIYRTQPALHEQDSSPNGFQWIDCHDIEQSTLSWLRRGVNPDQLVIFACNFTTAVRRNFRLGVPQPGNWREIFNSDANDYCGSGQGNLGGVSASPLAWHNQPYSLAITLPPLAAVAFKPYPP